MPLQFYECKFNTLPIQVKSSMIHFLIENIKYTHSKHDTVAISLYTDNYLIVLNKDKI